MPRVLDISSALLLLVMGAPWWLLRGVWSWLSCGRVLLRFDYIGRARQPYQQWCFADMGWAADSASVLNLLLGTISLVGPRRLRPHQARHAADTHFLQRPGWVSLYQVKAATGLAYEDEAALDQALVHYTLKQRLGLLARGGVLALLGAPASRNCPERFSLLGVSIDNLSMAQLLAMLEQALAQRQPCNLAFVNADCLNIAYRDAAYRQTLHSMTKVLADGMGVRLAAAQQQVRVRDNLNGTDVLPLLCQLCVKHDYALYLLGAADGVAQLAAERLQQQFPGLRIAGTQQGYFSEQQHTTLIEQINHSGADILLVGLGVPRQELWLQHHASQLQPTVRLGVGGLFDYYSGRIARAPLALRELGLE